MKELIERLKALEAKTRGQMPPTVKVLNVREFREKFAYAAPQLFLYIGRLEDALRAIKYNMEYLPHYEDASMEGQAKAVIATVINNTLEGEV